MKSIIILLVLFPLYVTLSGDVSATNKPNEYAVLERKIYEIGIRNDAHEKAHTTANDLFDSQFKNLLTWGSVLVAAMCVLLPLFFIMLQTYNNKRDLERVKKEYEDYLNGKINDQQKTFDSHKKEMDMLQELITLTLGRSYVDIADLQAENPKFIFMSFNNFISALSRFSLYKTHATMLEKSYRKMIYRFKNGPPDVNAQKETIIPMFIEAIEDAVSHEFMTGEIRNTLMSWRNKLINIRDNRPQPK